MDLSNGVDVLLHQLKGINKQLRGEWSKEIKRDVGGLEHFNYGLKTK